MQLSGNLCFKKAERQEVSDMICVLFISLLSDSPFGSLIGELWVGRRRH